MFLRAGPTRGAGTRGSVQYTPSLGQDRILDLLRDHPQELASLEQFPPLAAPPGDLVLRRADGLFRPAAGLHAHDVAIAGRGDETEHPVLVRRQLDEDDPFARAGQVVDLVGRTEDGARLGGRRDHGFLAGDLLDADDLDAVRRARIPPPGAGARLDERLEAEPQAEPVARHRQGVHWRRLPFLSRGDVAGLPRVEAQRRDDALAVAELEELLHRLAVAR